MRTLPQVDWLLRRWLIWAVPLGLFGLALTARFFLLRTPVYGDEAVLYYFSRHPLQDAHNVHILDENDTYPASLFFWWRPLFRLLFTPAAVISFEAYRLAYVLLAATLAPLAYLVLRAHDVRVHLAAGAGLVVAFFPPLVHWGAITFPDEPMLVAFALGLWALARSRAAWAGLAFTAAIWLKEVAVVGVAVLLVHDLVSDVRRRESSLWPLSLSRRNTALSFAIILGLAPLAYYMFNGGARPGWTPGGIGPDFYERVLPVIWILPLLVMGLGWPRTRALALLALAFPLFFYHYAKGLDGQVEAWYLTVPNFLALLAAALVIDEWGRRWPLSRPRHGWAPRATAALLAGVLLLQIAAPSTASYKAAIEAPITGQASWSLPETFEAETSRNRNLEDMVAHLPTGDLESVLLVDLGWFFIFYPFADRADTVRYAYTDWWPKSDHDVERWGTVVESQAEATVVGLYPPIRPLNEAIRTVYADCIRYSNDEYVILQGAACAGRIDRLIEEYERLLGSPLPDE